MPVPPLNLDQIESELQEKTLELISAHAQFARRERELQEEIERRGAIIRTQLGVLNDVSLSASWRATKPLRLISIFFSEVKSFFRNCVSGIGFSQSVKRFSMSTVSKGLSFVEVDLSDEDRIQEEHDYQKWISENEVYSEPEFLQAGLDLASRPSAPKISIILPVYNPHPAWLDEAIQSVIHQYYPNWELCIADDASSDPRIRDVLARYQDHVSIKISYREVNGHISAASNTALELASGEWVCFLDHDDLLAKYALLCVAAQILKSPELDLIYSDEDKIDEGGVRFDPYFKSDWNQALFRSHNLITHLAVVRLARVIEIGGFRSEFDGAQDYDLMLRYVETIKEESIQHIPHILYHWRSHAASTADADSDAKPYAMLAGERALNEHFVRLGLAAKAQFVGIGYRIRYQSSEEPLVSIIVPTYNKADLLKKCIQSILTKTRYSNYEVLIVDNNSDEPEAIDFLREIAEHEKVRVLEWKQPFNFSAINNYAVDESAGEYLCLLNNDIEILTSGWIHDFLGHASQASAGAVSGKLLYPNKTIQHAGIVLGINGWAGHAHKSYPDYSSGYMGRAVLVGEFSAVTGACLFIEKKKFTEVGGFDEVKLKVACNDVDLCLKLGRHGYKNIYDPGVRMIHYESATRGSDLEGEAKKRFDQELAVMRERWGALLQADPLYNPNLSIDRENFGLAWPSRVTLDDCIR